MPINTKLEVVKSPACPMFVRPPPSFFKSFVIGFMFLEELLNISYIGRGASRWEAQKGSISTRSIWKRQSADS